MKRLKGQLQTILLYISLIAAVTNVLHIDADEIDTRSLKSKNDLLHWEGQRIPKAPKITGPKAPKTPKAPKDSKSPKGSKSQKVSKGPKGVKMPKRPKEPKNRIPLTSAPMAIQTISPSVSPTRLPTPLPSVISSETGAFPSAKPSPSFLSQAPSVKKDDESSMNPSTIPSAMPSDSQSQNINLRPSQILPGSLSLIGARAKGSIINKISSSNVVKNSLPENFLLFSNINGTTKRKQTRERNLSSKVPMFICDNDTSLICDATALSSLTALWSVANFQPVRATGGVTAYTLYIRNSETGRYFTSEFGQSVVDIVENESLASFWTFEYGVDEMVVIHPGDYYDMALCMKNDGTGYYFKVGLGYKLPTVNILDLGENCLFPMLQN